MIATRLSSRWRAMAPSHSPRPRSGAGGRHAGLKHRAAPSPRAGLVARRRIPGRGEHHPLLGRLVARDLGGDPALVQDEDPVRHRQDLGQVARDQDDREARGGELGDDPVDLDLGADVDAAGRLVEDQHASGRSPATSRGRPSAGCRRTAPRPAGRRRSSARRTGRCTRGRPSAPSARAGQEAREQPGQDRQGHVLGDREVEDEAFLVAVLGQVGDARRSSPPTGRRSRRPVPASRISPASRRSIPNRTRATSVRPAPTRPAKPTISPARTEKLTSWKTPTRVRPLTSSRTSPTGRLDLGEQRDGAADHVPDEVGRRQLRRRRGDDVAAVAEDRRPVAQLEDLVEAVADEQHRDAAVAQAADDREQAVDLVRRQRGGRLVEDQDAGLDRQRLGDLDQLLVGHRQAADRRRDVELDVELLEQRLGAAAHRAPVDRPEARRRRVADEHVLGDASGRGTGAAPGGRRRSRARGRGPGPWITVGSPSSRMVPLSGWWTPARILTSVLLPAPFSPTSAWTSPARRSSDTSSSAWVAANRLEMP